MDRVEAAVRARVVAGHEGSLELWNRAGGATRSERRRRWWDVHRELFVAALVVSSPEVGSHARIGEGAGR